MSRLIDADKLYDYISDVFTEFGHDVMSVKDALKAVETAPTVNAVELPCKVGDMVYVVSNDIEKWKILHLNFSYTNRDGGEIFSAPIGIIKDAIGETVFLTRKEAEQALRERGLK